jgi:hypothetical protein
VVRGLGRKREYVFRTPNQKWDREMVTGRSTGKGLSQMFWGCIWKGGRSPLYRMNRDHTLPTNGYNSTSYCETLRLALLPDWDDWVDLFQQDNALIHTLRLTSAFMQYHLITTLIWPPYSPDLNPIEHLWWKLKQTIYELYPHLEDEGLSVEAREAFEDAAQEAWERIDQEWIDGLINTMGRRIKAVIKARGWQTKY